MTREPAQPAVGDARKQPHRLRLRAANRLRKRADFARVYRDGIRARGQYILTIALPSNQPGAPRLGVSVGRKYSRSAVTRNRAKRLLREGFRLQRPFIPPWDLILIPHQGKFPSLNEIQSDLENMVLRLQERFSK